VMTAFWCLLFVLLNVNLSFGANVTGACDFSDALPDAAFIRLVKDIQAARFSSDKVQVVRNWAASNNTLGLTAKQTTTLFSLFDFSSDQITVLKLVNDFVLILDVSGLVTILKTLKFSSDQMITLKSLVNLTSAVDLKQNSQKVIDFFTFSSDKDEARRVIDSSIPRSCIFGPVSLLRFAFIIDVSGSMRTTFIDSDGISYTRLQYVQKDLISVLNNTLRPIQEFNIISFSTRPNAWKPGVVPVNFNNVIAAEAYTRTLVADGGTNMGDAFRLAFSDPKVIGVYFLSDGEPTDNGGGQAVLNYLATVKKPVHAIAFKSTREGQAFLASVVRTTGGTFRAIL